MIEELSFDKKCLFKYLAWLIAMVILMKMTNGAVFIIAFIVLFWCISKKNDEILFYILLITITVSVSNSRIVIRGGSFTLLQRLLLLILSVVMIYRMTYLKKSNLLVSFLSLFIYILYMFISSAFGWCPYISYLKLFLFSMIYLAYLGISNSIINNPIVDVKRIRSIFLAIAMFFILGSILLVPLGIGYMSGEAMLDALRDGQDVVSLFMGMSQHSQALGPICSMLGILLYSDMIFSIRSIDKLYILLLICVPFLIWKTSSRTAMGAFIAGIAFTTFCFTNAKNISADWRTKVYNTIMIIVIIITLVIISFPQTNEKLMNFIMKSVGVQNQELSFDKVMSSRQDKWNMAIYNFNKSPIIGNGFQVSEKMIGSGNAMSSISSTIEKSIWISAILEEGGIIGMILFILFLAIVFLSLSKHKSYQGLCALFSILVINLGEFTIFSMSSLGGILWILVFIAIIFDALRQKEDVIYNIMLKYTSE